MKRENYIDAMRGLAMVMVIVYHVTEDYFHSDNLIVRLVNIQLQLPLFFFISGFFAGKMTRTGFLHGWMDKVKRLLIPSLLMLALYCWVKDLSLVDSLNARMKSGYWFTLVLFAFVTIFLVTDKVSGLLRVPARFKPLVHLLVGCAWVYLASFSEKFNATYPIINTFSIGEYNHYVFYVLGYLFFLYMDRVESFVDRHKWTMAAVIIAYFVLDVCRYKYGFESLRLLAMMTVTLLIALGLLIIWKLFKAHEDLFTGTTWGGRLCLVGRRSIDIYFIHYLLLPRQTPFINEFVISLNSPFLEYCLAVVLALLLVVASLLMGQILRLSPFVARWFLGGK